MKISINVLAFLVAASFSSGSSFAQDQNAPGEPERIEYQLSKIAPHEKIPAEQIEAILKVLGPQGIFHIYEVEGHPGVVPEELASRVKIEHDAIPASVNDEFNEEAQAEITAEAKAQSPETISKWSAYWREVIQKPTAEDKFVGIAFGAVRFTMAATAFMTSGVHPFAALTMALVPGGMTWFTNRNHQTFAHLFDENADLILRKKYGDRLAHFSPAEIESKKERLIFWQSFAYDITTTQMMSSVGNQNSFAQVMGTTLLSAVPYNYFNAIKTALFRGQRRLGLSLNLITSPLIYYFMSQDAVGHYAKLGSVGGFEIHSTLVGSFAVYALAILSTKVAPNQVIKVSRKIYDFFIEGAKTKLSKMCNRQMHRASQ